MFGSRARGDARPGSDADIAVLLETGVRIQPLPIWREEWQRPETYSNLRLLHNIEREGVLL